MKTPDQYRELSYGKTEHDLGDARHLPAVLELCAALREAADQLAMRPTREQIAEVLYENQFRGGYHAEWDRLVEDGRDHWLSQADAVLALLQKEADR